MSNKSIMFSNGFHSNNESGLSSNDESSKASKFESDSSKKIGVSLLVLLVIVSVSIFLEVLTCCVRVRKVVRSCRRSYLIGII